MARTYSVTLEIRPSSTECETPELCTDFSFFTFFCGLACFCGDISKKRIVHSAFSRQRALPFVPAARICFSKQSASHIKSENLENLGFPLLSNMVGQILGLEELLVS